MSRYTAGGFEPRFVVRRTDGKPCREQARYIVMDGSGADPHAVIAIRVYAASVRAENPKLADDILAMIGMGGTGLLTDGEWPPELAQHENAK